MEILLEQQNEWLRAIGNKVGAELDQRGKWAI